jgi:LAS superfamily LD-carboxypeptidase LdcB
MLKIMTLSHKSKNAVVAILNAFQDNLDHLNVPLLTYPDLLKLLTPYQQQVLGNFIDAQTAPTIPLVDSVVPGGDTHTVRFVRLSQVCADEFAAMNQQLHMATKQSLNIASGYRSPAYQTLVFLRELYNASFDMVLATRVAKLPAQSQHCQYPYHAVDLTLAPYTGQELGDHFAGTTAYQWLCQNAANYGFSQPYSKPSAQTIFEPWHWLYSGC